MNITLDNAEEMFEEIDCDFSKQDKELLSELNRIINHIDNGYLWRELSTFDLKLRERLKELNG